MSNQPRGLGGVAARGGLETLAGQFAKIIIQVASLLILSRLLPPTDFGIYAMAAVVIGLGELLRDFGLAAAAMRAPTLTRAESSNLFWLNALVGSGLMLLTLLLAAPVSWLFDESRVAAVLVVVAPILLLNALQTQFQVDLARSMGFIRLVSSDILGQLLGLAAGVTCAILGLSYWSLVAQQLVVAITLLLVRLGLSDFRPMRPQREVSVRQFIAFGGFLSLAQILGYSASNADTVTIGARFGSIALGLYSRAFQLLMVPVSQVLAPLTSVVLPVLRHMEIGSARLWEALLRLQHAVAFVLIPALATAAGIAEPMIVLVLGDEWRPIAPLFVALAIGGAFQVLSYVGFWVFLVHGETQSLLWYNLLSKVVTVAIVVVSSQGGVLGVALGFSAAVAASWPFCLWWLKRRVGLPAARFLRGGLAALGAGGLAYIGASVASSELAGYGDVAMVLAGSAVGLLLPLSIVIAWPSGRRQVISTWTTLRRSAPMGA
jgi:PST family polysaccharide transporter